MHSCDSTTLVTATIMIVLTVCQLFLYLALIITQKLKSLELGTFLDTLVKPGDSNLSPVFKIY